MSISVKTRKMLWGRAASRCARPDCRIELFMDASETDDATLVGEECHMVAQEEDGPRGHSALTAQQRDSYGNLILLCCNHHTLIDKNERDFPVERLQTMKADHEIWVRTRLAGFDAARQRDDEVYASIVEEWASRAALDVWDGWASGLTCHGHPRVEKGRLDALEGLNRWLFTRVWPGRYPALEAAFENFRRVLQDLLNTINENAETVGPEEAPIIQVEKFYRRLRGWDEEAYERLSKQFEFVVNLVEDLTFELTRAANALCDAVRATIMPVFRLREGLVVITTGPDMNLTMLTLRLKYEPGVQYEGMDTFMVERVNRDYAVGSGASPEGLRGRHVE